MASVCMTIQIRLRKIYEKLKEIFLNKNVQRVVIVVCSIAVSVYIGGKIRANYRKQYEIKSDSFNTSPGAENVTWWYGKEKYNFSDSNNNHVWYPWEGLKDYTDDFDDESPPAWGNDFDIFYPKLHTRSPLNKRCSEVMKYGFPGTDNIRVFNDFVLSYNNSKRVANWVYEHITLASLKGNKNVNVDRCDLDEDRFIHPYFGTSPADFLETSFFRHQLANPKHHHMQQKHLDDTFLMPNMIPLADSVNWKRLERHVLKLLDDHPEIYCCTGTLFMPQTEPDGTRYIRYQTIGLNKIAVPTHLFKFVIAKNDLHKLDVECYVMENKPFASYLNIDTLKVDPQVVEKAAGLLLMHNLPPHEINSINGRPLSELPPAPVPPPEGVKDEHPTISPPLEVQTQPPVENQTPPPVKPPSEPPTIPTAPPEDVQTPTGPPVPNVTPSSPPIRTESPEGSERKVEDNEEKRSWFYSLPLPFNMFK